SSTATRSAPDATPATASTATATPAFRRAPVRSTGRAPGPVAVAAPGVTSGTGPGGDAVPGGGGTGGGGTGGGGTADVVTFGTLGPDAAHGPHAHRIAAGFSPGPGCPATGS